MDCTMLQGRLRKRRQPVSGRYVSLFERTHDGWLSTQKPTPSRQSHGWSLVLFDEFLGAKVTVYPKIIPYYVVILGRPLLRFQNLRAQVSRQRLCIIPTNPTHVHVQTTGPPPTTCRHHPRRPGFLTLPLRCFRRHVRCHPLAHSYPHPLYIYRLQDHFHPRCEYPYPIPLPCTLVECRRPCSQQSLPLCIRHATC